MGTSIVSRRQHRRPGTKRNQEGAFHDFKTLLSERVAEVQRCYLIRLCAPAYGRNFRVSTCFPQESYCAQAIRLFECTCVLELR